MILKAIICLFKGHDICPNESIVNDIMFDKRNWICKCHRCGLYEMHDSTISGESITITEKQAMHIKMNLEADLIDLRTRMTFER